MKRNHLDKKLKTDLKDYVSEVDFQQLWSDLEPRIEPQPKRKKRPFIWLWLILGFLGLGIATSLMTSKQNLSAPSNKVILPKASTSNNEPMVSANKELLLDQPLNPINPDAPANINPQKAVNAATTKNTIPFKNNPKVLKTKTENSHTTNKTSDQANSISVSPPTEKMEASKLSIPIKKPEENNLTTLSATTLRFPKAVSQIDYPFSGLKSNRSLVEENLFALEEAVILELKKKFEEDYKAPNFNAHKKAFEFSLQLQGGLSFTKRSLEDKNNVSANYLDRRQTSEQVLETVHLGVFADLTHRSGLEVSTGIQLSKITEEFNFQGSIIEHDTIEQGLYGYHINPTGDTTFVYDRIINSKETFHQKIVYNRYRMIDIPILLGYQWQHKNWSLGVQAGVFANLRLKTSGIIFDAQDVILDIEQEQDQLFHSSIGLSYYFGAVGRYHINDHLQITASPFFRYLPKSFSKANYTLEQRYNLTGIKLGIRYSF